MKNIVISGATKGIGRAIAEKFAAEKYNVAVCARNETQLLAMKSHIEEEYAVKCLVFKADMSVKSEVLAFADLVKSEFDKVDILVNNAGFFLPGQVHSEEDGTLEKQIETNLYSAYHLSRALIPSMLENKDGHIFNICSVASIIAYPNGGSYSISKFAMLGLSKALREEMKPHNIRVTALLPGATYTASWEGVELPQERFMKSEDIANTVYATYELSKQTVIEEIIMRPQLGDL